MPPKGSHVVYFVRTAPGELKIGASQHLALRLRTLSVHFGPLELIGYLPGDRRDEARMHARFAPYRVRGEIFRNFGAVAKEADRAANFMRGEQAKALSAPPTLDAIDAAFAKMRKATH